MHKKSIIVIVCLCLLGSVVTGCKSKDVKYVEELIDSIGEVSIDSGEEIFKAEEAYEYLSPADRSEVENYNLLEDAIEEYNSIPLGVWTEYWTLDHDCCIDGRQCYEGDEFQTSFEFSDNGTVREELSNLTQPVWTPVDYNYTDWSIDEDGFVTMTTMTIPSATYRFQIVEENGNYVMVDIDDCRRNATELTRES